LNFLTDLFYFSSLNDNSAIILNTFYEKNPDQYHWNLKKIFDLDLRKYLTEAVGLSYKAKYTQEEVYELLTVFANGFHEYRSDIGFFVNRGVTLDQVDRFKLGNVAGYFDFLEQDHSVLDRYNYELAKDLVDYFIYAVEQVGQLYDNLSIVTIPSFDKDKICKGIVGRVVGYVPKDESMRNIYKFFNTNPSTYFLGENILDSYEWVYLVEGVFDLMALDRIGIKNVVTASATSISDKHVNKLKGIKVAAVFDNDKGGYYGIKRLMKQDIDLVRGIQFALAKDIDEADSNTLRQWIEKTFVGQYDKVCSNIN